MACHIVPSATCIGYVFCTCNLHEIRHPNERTSSTTKTNAKTFNKNQYKEHCSYDKHESIVLKKSKSKPEIVEIYSLVYVKYVGYVNYVLQSVACSDSGQCVCSSVDVMTGAI